MSSGEGGTSVEQVQQRASITELQNQPAAAAAAAAAAARRQQEEWQVR
jgi:hypothetical protein